MKIARPCLLCLKLIRGHAFAKLGLRSKWTTQAPTAVDFLTRGAELLKKNATTQRGNKNLCWLIINALIFYISSLWATQPIIGDYWWHWQTERGTPRNIYHYHANKITIHKGPYTRKFVFTNYVIFFLGRKYTRSFWSHLYLEYHIIDSQSPKNSTINSWGLNEKWCPL